MFLETIADAKTVVASRFGLPVIISGIGRTAVQVFIKQVVHVSANLDMIFTPEQTAIKLIIIRQLQLTAAGVPCPGGTVALVGCTGVDTAVFQRTVLYGIS